MRSDPLQAGADLTVVERPDDVSADDVSAAVAADGREPEPQIVTAAPQRKRRRSGGLLADVPLALVICGVGLGLLVIAMHHFRWGNLAIAGGTIAAACLRSVLPARRIGLLAVRGRVVDVLTMGSIGIALMVLALHAANT